jgi:hypothetical protein
MGNQNVFYNSILFIYLSLSKRQMIVEDMCFEIINIIDVPDYIRQH